jgi:serine/threonine protein phosphatase PrpC
MKKVLLRSVLTFLASVSILAAAMSGAEAKAAGQLSQKGRAVQRQGSYLPAKAQSRCLCASQASLQKPVVPPEIWLDSYSTKPGQSIGFGGRGFLPGEQVDVRLGNLEDVPSKSASRLLVAAFANAGGNVNGEASIPFLPPGDYPFIVVGLQSQDMLIRNLTVLGFAPWVVLDNYAPPPSARLGFQGQGFAPGEPVLVYFDRQTGQQIAQLKADRDGQFAVNRGVELPAQLGDHSLILVGVNSGSVVKVNFEILPPAPAPTPSPTTDRSATLAQTSPRPAAGGSARALFTPAASVSSAHTRGTAPGMSSALGAFSFQNPLMLVLVLLLLWLLLCIFLALLLFIAPLFQKLGFRRRASQEGASRSLQECEGLTDAATPASSATGVIAPVPFSVQHRAHPPARFCPRCGVQIAPEASRCAVCRGELPQTPRLASEEKERSLSQAAASPVFSPWLPDGSAGASVEKQAALQPSRTSMPERGGEEYRSSARQHQPGLALCFSARSDRGRKRAACENEDSFLAVTGALRRGNTIEPFGLFVVADGMGGHADGHKASGTAVEALFHSLVPTLLQQDWPEHAVLPLLAQAIQGVNERLYQANQHDHTAMGCTVTAALVMGRAAHICNVGDSRTYLLGSLAPLQRVTVDHSLVESLVVAGIIQRADVYTHPKRNQIFRCLGHQPWVEVDTFHQPLTSGEFLLLCSDGLWEMVRDPEMEATLRQTHDVAQASSMLVARANENGGLDNITVIVVQLTNEDRPFNQPGITSLASNQSGLLVNSA